MAGVFVIGGCGWGGGSFDFYSVANLTANLWATGSLPGGLGFIICEAASEGTGGKQEMRN